ncbi:TIGR03086 family metal-binding protein [Streptomyces asiaticus]|uniref:TIGR03086 family metal-binding protein n=1 Tax=Streptomyces sp. NPDC059455 TaxID=3346837 RepID=UPI00368DBC58
MDTIEALADAYEQTRECVANLAISDFAMPTPCPGWDVRAVLGHIVSDTWMFTRVNHVGAFDEDEDDKDGLIGCQLISDLDAAAAANLASWRNPGAFEGDRTYPFGTFPATQAALINLQEVVVHNWDIAKTVGRKLVIDEEVGNSLYDLFRSLPLDVFRARGAFGPEVSVARSAPILDRLVALLGRHP